MSGHSIERIAELIGFKSATSCAITSGTFRRLPASGAGHLAANKPLMMHLYPFRNPPYGRDQPKSRGDIPCPVPERFSCWPCSSYYAATATPSQAQSWPAGSISLRALYRDIACLQAQGAHIEGEPGIGCAAPRHRTAAADVQRRGAGCTGMGSRWVVAHGDSA